jgi:hypothetical protein
VRNSSLLKASSIKRFEMDAASVAHHIVLSDNFLEVKRRCRYSYDTLECFERYGCLQIPGPELDYGDLLLLTSSRLRTRMTCYEVVQNRHEVAWTGVTSDRRIPRHKCSQNTNTASEYNIKGPPISIVQYHHQRSKA